MHPLLTMSLFLMKRCSWFVIIAVEVGMLVVVVVLSMLYGIKSFSMVGKV